ncbi:hypothetical protein FQZ37_23960 [Escherichia coli]|uniref:hypothetical protein n=1 Tax=Escherichia coli TaxID=562 RepID=UPI001321D28B|nr:hypothetical protein [Escherichia coli]MXC43249.1 hypothetical protein [Escherichia coli]MXE31310.1 hypothetical protein [Escherichia coli]MXE70708.1 hypothetical protein [Escherichia coli]MXF28672.1 hypothetical protein [Escherichia coli]
MTDTNKQVELFKAVRQLSELSDDSLINASALCRMLDIDNGKVRQRMFQTGESLMTAITYYLNK